MCQTRSTPGDRGCGTGGATEPFVETCGPTNHDQSTDDGADSGDEQPTSPEFERAARIWRD